MKKIICPSCGLHFSIDVSTVKQVEEKVQVKIEPVKSDGQIKRAQPVLSNYRENFKKKRINPEDIMAKRTVPKIKQFDADFGKFTHKGESLFFGDGVELEI